MTNLNITPFSPALFLDLIDNISNLFLHYFLLIARHYIYSCKLRDTIAMVQVYTQLVIHSMEIEEKIAFVNNNLASLRKKWATFNQYPSENNFIYTVNQRASDKQADGRRRTITQAAFSQLLMYKLQYFCGLCLSFSFYFTFFPSVPVSM